MNLGVPLSVLIPTHGRPAKLAACIAALSTQDIGEDQYEVVVGIDGPDESSDAAAIEAWRGRDRARLRLIPCPRSGLMEVRNRLLREARGDVLVSINDDIIPSPGFLRAHRDAHAEQGGRAIVVGHSPFRRRDPGTMLDRLVAETSMIFFYDQMNTPQARADRAKDWGFRHVFGLNFSASLAAVREVGGFFSRPLLYGYEDIELGFRLQRTFQIPVLYRPEALAEHDHFYKPQDILDRERQLGRAAWHVAGANPEFARAVFGREIRSEQELEYSRRFIEHEGPLAGRLKESFLGLGDMPWGAVEGASAPAVITLIYQQHLPLKRWAWRTGLLEAAAESV